MTHNSRHRSTILLAAGFISAAASIAWSAPMAGDGPACTEKAKAAKLATLTDLDPEYITIWATGMQDGSCRGYSAGQEVTVEKREDGLACVRAEDDQTCFWITETKAPQ
ncbi:MAG: hypothetical protein AB7I79_18535 [Rhizobiaceae bacterium]